MVKQLKKIRRKMDVLKYICIVITSFLIVCTVALILFIYKYISVVNSIRDNSAEVKAYETEIQGLKDKTTELNQDIVFMTNEYNKLYNDFTALTNTCAAEKAQVDNLMQYYDSENEEYKMLKNRAELYDKYDYAFVNQMDGNLPVEDLRTDITYDQVATLEQLAHDNGLSDDAVKLVLAIAMNESRGQEASKNPYSTATGYCGILDFTGKFVYEELMGNPKDSYTHDMAYNGYLNLEMSLMYIKYLNAMYNGDVEQIIKEYRGCYDADYFYNIEANLNRADSSIYSLVLAGI